MAELTPISPSAQAELGPALSPRWQTYQLARDVARWAEQAMELSIDGPRMDLPRAEQLLDRIRALLGPGQGA